MKRSFGIELTAGFFVIIGIVCLGYLSVRLGGLEMSGGERYEVTADFSDVGGLKTGAPVVIAGVEIGRVGRIALDEEDYEARVTLQLDRAVKLETDAMASIKTRGLIGEKYVAITSGGEDRYIEPGGRLVETEPAIDIESLISKIAFGKL